MINYVEDMWGEPVYGGDTVIASRPAGAGTTMLEYCSVINITEKSVSLRVLQKNGDPYIPRNRWESDKFTLKKGYDGDKCSKIVRYTA